MTVSTSSSSSSSVTRIQPLLLLAKSARGAAAAKLIFEATAAPGCYLFSELAHTEGVKALAQDEAYASSTALLNLFLYGTLSDYLAAPASYPALTQNHINKLRQLTLVSLASSSRSLGYARLLNELKLNVHITHGSLHFDDSQSAQGQGGPDDGDSGSIELTTIRALEDVIIDSTYAGLLTGRLDQKTRRFHVDFVMGRDVGGDAELQQMEESLRSWGDTTNALLSELSQRIDRAKAESASSTRAQKAHDQELATSLLALQQHQQTGATRGQAGPGTSFSRLNDAEEMDLDGVEEKKGSGFGTKKSRSKRTRT